MQNVPELKETKQEEINLKDSLKKLKALTKPEEVKSQLPTSFALLTPQ